MQNVNEKRSTVTNFEALSLQHLDSLHSTARHLTRDPADAQDLVQETYLRAFQHFDGFQPGTNFRAWIFTILRNTFINQYHEKKRLPRVDLDTVEPVLGSSGDAAAVDARLDVNGSAVTAAIESLPVEQRMMLMLAYTEELSYREIAEVMECPIGTVMSRLFRARRHIRESLRGKRRGSARKASTRASGDRATLPRVA